MATEATGQLKWWGTRYSVRVRFADGDRAWVPLPPGLSHAEAVERAREVAQRARVQSKPDDVTVLAAGAETVNEWVERWLAMRKDSGLETTKDDRFRLNTHILPFIGKKPIRAVTSADIEDIRDHLDARIHRGEMAWQTAFNAWTCLRIMFRDARSAKRRDVRVRADNPTNDVAPPDRGTERVKQYLYPNEFLQLVSCKDVPLGWRRSFALATYLLLRMGELAVLAWDDIDLERGTIHVHRALRRRTDEEKETKSGSKRRFMLEPTIMPLLRAMHEETGGRGRISLAAMPVNKSFRHFAAIAVREYLAAAGVRRPELFTDDATRKWITFHDLRATGITWMAVRGDDPLKIKQRAGHSHLITTERYIRVAEELRDGFGVVFPALPRTLVR